MSLDPLQFRLCVIDPIIRQLGLYSPAASNLLLGTALVESGLIYLNQLKNGPARGLFQMEMATHDDIIANYLPAHPELYSKLLNLKAAGLTNDENMLTGMAYQAAMCRIFYLRIPEALPAPTDAAAMAHYHKVYYNTAAGSTVEAESVAKFQAAIDVGWA